MEPSLLTIVLHASSSIFAPSAAIRSFPRLRRICRPKNIIKRPSTSIFTAQVENVFVNHISEVTKNLLK